jgi:hypothetical protein
VRGRAFTAADTTDAMMVALINEEMARIYWPGRDPIGGRFKIGMNPSRPWVRDPARRLCGTGAHARRNRGVKMSSVFLSSTSPVEAVEV